VEKTKILIMDDEDFVRSVAAKMLDFLGYEAVPARTGEEALALYESHLRTGRPIGAAILDWMVPGGMDGFRTMERLREIDPAARGVLSSGYPDQDDGRMRAAGFVDVIGKPYELQTLKETLERVAGPSPR
jgi:CheY-like chemotaxis protein